MNTSLELLNWFRNTHELSSDYMVGKLTGISKQSLSNVRNGKTEFSESNIMKLLCVGEHPEPLKTFAKIEAYKATIAGNTKLAEIWKNAAA